MTLFSLIRLCGRYGRWQLSLQRDINVAMHFMQKSNYIEDALIKHHKLDRAINWSTCCHFRKRESLHLRRNCEISRAPCINLSRIPGNGLLPHRPLLNRKVYKSRWTNQGEALQLSSLWPAAGIVRFLQAYWLFTERFPVMGARPEVRN